MTAAFTFAAVYQAEAVCRTPLHTGGTEQVLRDRDGRALLQGSSLAGALKGWLMTACDTELVNALFGTQKAAGRLVVSDALFDTEAEQDTRPRLRIDPATATEADGAKFDVSHIGAGSRLGFTLTWLGTQEAAEPELSAVEQALAALNAGLICLGAQKSNGFGQLSLTVKKRVFDLTDPGNRRDWLDDKIEGTPLPLPDPAQKRGIVFTVKGHSDNLLVKTAPEYYDTPDGFRSYTPNLSEGGCALLPGSSIKGAVRGRCTYIAKLLHLDGAFVDQYFGRTNRDRDNGLPGQIRFEDAMLFDTKRKLSRVRIDRFTGGVFRGGLFTEEPVSSDVTLRITAPEEPKLCALLLYALRDLGLGLYNLGSGWAIGRGQLALRAIEASAPDGRTAALRQDEQGGLQMDDPSGLFQNWLEELEKEVRHES